MRSQGWQAPSIACARASSRRSRCWRRHSGRRRFGNVRSGKIAKAESESGIAEEAGSLRRLLYMLGQLEIKRAQAVSTPRFFLDENARDRSYVARDKAHSPLDGLRGELSCQRLGKR